MTDTVTDTVTDTMSQVSNQAPPLAEGAGHLVQDSGKFKKKKEIMREILCAVNVEISRCVNFAYFRNNLCTLQF